MFTFRIWRNRKNDHTGRGWPEWENNIKNGFTRGNETDYNTLRIGPIVFAWGMEAMQ